MKKNDNLEFDGEIKTIKSSCNFGNLDFKTFSYIGFFHKSTPNGKGKIINGNIKISPNFILSKLCCY